MPASSASSGLKPRRRPESPALSWLPLVIIRPERAAITGETGLLRALEGAFERARIAVSRADLRVAIQSGAAKLRPLLQRLTDKATPIAVDTIVKPKPPALILLIDQGEELFLAEGLTSIVKGSSRNDAARNAFYARRRNRLAAAFSP